MSFEAPIRVLLVDDDEVDRMAIQRALAGDGAFSITECRDADAALERLRSGAADVVLCDLHMPGHDGAWLLDEVRRHDLDIPVVMLTGQGDELTAVRLMKAGAHDYLVKDTRAEVRLPGTLRAAVQVQQANRRTRVALEALRESERRLRLALEAAELGTYELDVESGNIEMDARCRTVFGLRPDSPATEASVRAAIHPDDRARVEALERSLFALDGAPTSTSIHRVIGIDDGVVRWVQVVGRATFAGDRPSRIVGTVADVTERRRQEELDRQRAEFEQQLIGIVSHDLRNPLSAMLMSASLLTYRLPAESAESRVAHRIVSSGQRASRLIHDLLDFTQARSSAGIPLARREVDIHDTCRSAIEEIMVSWPARTITFQRVGEGAGCWDPDRIEQIITNLVTNALTYGDPNGVVTVRCSTGPERATLEVHNFGPVIPEHVRDRLFEPYTRQNQHSDPERGIGLGLFIVREIVRAHGGSAGVESDERLGTTFTVELPRGGGASGGSV